MHANTHCSVLFIIHIHYTPPKNCLVEKKVEFLRFSGFEEQNGWHEWRNLLHIVAVVLLHASSPFAIFNRSINKVIFPNYYKHLAYVLALKMGFSVQ